MTLHVWEVVAWVRSTSATEVRRLPVPGGWIYDTGEHQVCVPIPVNNDPYHKDTLT